MLYTLTMEYSSALNSMEIFTHATTQMKLENIMPSKVKKKGTKRQILNDFTYMKYLRVVKIMRQKTEWWLPGPGERGE